MEKGGVCGFHPPLLKYMDVAGQLRGRVLYCVTEQRVENLIPHYGSRRNASLCSLGQAAQP